MPPAGLREKAGHVFPHWIRAPCLASSHPECLIKLSRCMIADRHSNEWWEWHMERHRSKRTVLRLRLILMVVQQKPRRMCTCILTTQLDTTVFVDMFRCRCHVRLKKLESKHVHPSGDEECQPFVRNQVYVS